MTNFVRADHGHAHQLGRSYLIAGVAGILPVHVILDPPSDAVEFDSRADVSVLKLPRFGGRQVLGFEQLQLEWHQQPVLGKARPQPDGALARLHHGAARDGLQSVEVRQPRRTRLVGLPQPQRLALLLGRGVRVLRLRLDARADRVADERVERDRSVSLSRKTSVLMSLVAGVQPEVRRVAVAAS